MPEAFRTQNANCIKQNDDAAANSTSRAKKTNPSRSPERGKGPGVFLSPPILSPFPVRLPKCERKTFFPSSLISHVTASENSKGGGNSIELSRCPKLSLRGDGERGYKDRMRDENVRTGLLSASSYITKFLFFSPREDWKKFLTHPQGSCHQCKTFVGRDGSEKKVASPSGSIPCKSSC